MRSILLAATALALTAGEPAAAFYEYSVTGVTAGDVLNIRENVASADAPTSARIVGTIPAGAGGVKGTGVTIVIGDHRWYEVSYDGVIGWVSGRYLAPVQDGSGAPPTELACSGTEPFWSIKFSDGHAVREQATGDPSAEATDYLVSTPNLAVGRNHVWAVNMTRRGGAGSATAVFLRTDSCSDGMSDFTYPIDFVFSETDDEQTVLSGCCRLLR